MLTLLEPLNVTPLVEHRVVRVLLSDPAAIGMQIVTGKCKPVQATLRQMGVVCNKAAILLTFQQDALLLAGKPITAQRIPARRIRMGSDACTDAAHPAIYGMAESLAYVFPLTGAWLRLHVTVTESAGACLDFLVFPRRFPLALFCNETDASAAHAMVLGRSKSPTLRKMYSLLRKDPYFQAAAQRSTSQ